MICNYMQHFINLTSRVINKLQIIEIVKKPSMYHIHMSNNHIDGIMLFSTGSIWNEKNIIKVCEKNNKQDYDTITEIIQKIK